MRPCVESWSSPELMFQSKLDEVDKVVNEIVDASCTSPGSVGELV